MLRKIDLMHKLFGELPDRKCKECQHLASYTASRKWYKCECYGQTCSEASDWRLKYTACGLFNKEYTGNPVMKMVGLYHLEQKPQVERQLVLDEFVNISVPDRAWVKPDEAFVISIKHKVGDFV